MTFMTWTERMANSTAAISEFKAHLSEYLRKA
jgi:hypothetical protein